MGQINLAEHYFFYPQKLMSFNFQVRIFTVVYPIYCTLFNSTHFFLRDIKFLRTLINFNFFFFEAAKRF